jgi:ribonucleoside-diphosphate reductase alpha chain
MEDDSIDGIYNTLKDCAMISKYSGGIGLHIHNIRGKGAHIQGTNGKTDGIVPMLRVFNSTARYVNQCFTPDSWVYTKEGPKQMGDIDTQDELITIDGSFQKVNQVIKNQVKKEILEIRATNTLFPIKVTGEHEIYLIKNQKKLLNYQTIKNRLEKKIVEPSFYSASEINENDLLGVPIPTYVKDNDIEDLDYYKFYGMMLGDGHICSNNRESGITLGTENKKELINFTRNYLKKKNIFFWESEKTGCISIKWTSNKNNELLNLYREILYNDKNEKQIIGDYLHLPKNKILKIIEGLIKTDGSNLKELYFYNSSLTLIMQIRYIFFRLGILTSGHIKDKIGESHETIHGRTIITRKLAYILRIPKHPILTEILDFKCEGKFLKYFEWNNTLWGRIKNIQKINYEGDVFDFNMINNHNYLTDMGLVHNSGKRNGSFAIYLEPWHPDIEDFLELRKNHGDEELKARDLFYALWVPDLFMQRVKNNENWSLFCPHKCPGLQNVFAEYFVSLYETYEKEGKANKTVNARELWFKILDAQMETGTPYLLFKDAANKKSNQQNIGPILSSNLCVAPETLVLTDEGHYEIQTLEGKTVNIWNGTEWSKTTIHKTGENQPLLEVTTSDGCILNCTPYHKFYIQESYSKNSIKIVEAKELKQNDKLIKCEFPVIDYDINTNFKSNKKMKYAYTHGFFCGDGTYNQNLLNEKTPCNFKALNGHSYCKRHIDYENNNNEFPIQTNETNHICKGISYANKPLLSLYGEKKELIPYLDYRSIGKEDAQGRLNLCLPLDIDEKFFVPFHYSLKDRLEWFSGYCDADGCIARNGTNEQLQISSIHKDFLFKIKLMLQTCSINAKVTLMKMNNQRLMPDSNRNLKIYECKELSRLLITSVDLKKLVDLGFSPKRLKINSSNIPNRNANQFVKIVSVLDKERKSDTYCFNEPKKHMGIFNGILTGQCCEIIQYSDDKETAVCNLASIGLPTFVNKKTKQFNYEKLHHVTKVITNNLNKVIDINFYPTDKTKRSNLLHRPIGIGVQGLADTFILMDIAFHSEEAKVINKNIFETIYHAALEKSNEIAIQRKNKNKQIILKIKEIMQYQSSTKLLDDIQELTVYGGKDFIYSEIMKLPFSVSGSYSSFHGSPASKGILQFDLWDATHDSDSGRYNWNELKESIKTHGLRNSLLVAPMPTASTSQILGFNECFEPFTSNLYSRRTLAGEFVVVNKYLMKELIDLGHWNEKIKNNIIANKGSIQQLDFLPEHTKNKYKIVWEIPMKHIIDMAADRGAFICQSQSMNLWMEDPTYHTLTSMHFYSWSKGLKTGIYYLRRKGKHQAQQFTIEPEKTKENNILDEEVTCEMCSG